MTTVVLLLSIVLSCTNDSLPPQSLIQENIKKSNAILKAHIISSEMPKGQFAATTIKVDKVLRGRLHSGATLTYYSFKEQNSYPKEWLSQGIIVFLAAKKDRAGKVQWGTATDISEFGYSEQLEKQIVRLQRVK